MTWALCLNCGEIKWGAICACKSCGVESSGDMGLDIAFSDHHLSRDVLEQFGAVVKTIHENCDDAPVCFWAFIRYVSENHPSILTAKPPTEVADKVLDLPGGIEVPPVEL